MIAEVIYGDGRVTRSAPVAVSVGTTGTPVAANPESFNITRNLPTGRFDLRRGTARGVSRRGGAGEHFPDEFAHTGDGAQLGHRGELRFIKPNLGAAGQDVIQYAWCPTPGNRRWGP